jgi:hypothetical protein
MAELSATLAPPVARIRSVRSLSRWTSALTTGANILGLIKGVSHGTRTKSCSNVSIHLAKLLSASAVDGMGTLPTSAAFRMMRRASICEGIIKKRKKAKRA